MKTTITLKKMLLVFCLIFGLNSIQAQCSITASSSVGPNGVVSFTATGFPSNINNQYNWYFPGSPTGNQPYSSSVTATANYTANGTYTVYANLYNSVSTCTATAILVVVVNTNTVAPPVCTLNVTYTAPTSSVSCNGSAVVTPPTNMCGTITYAWSNGATGASVTGLCPATTYDVMATSPSGVNCCSVSIGMVNVPASPACNLVSNFNWTSAVNGVVNFNSTSTNVNGGATYAWSFGDGGTSTSASPVHTYSANGIYQATLTVNNNVSPACTSTKILNVFVNSYCNLVAGFTTNSLTSNSIQFSNTSSGTGTISAYSWNFGDGSSSISYNPQHTYTATGTYTVYLTATSPNGFGCTATASAVINISTICVANAGFTLTPSGVAQVWNAIPSAPLSVATATWSWGDGTFSNTLFTSHTYSAAGLYSICLFVTSNCGATASYCWAYNIFRSSQNNNQTMVTVNVLDPSQTTGINANTASEHLNYNIYPNPNNGNFNLDLSGLPEGPVKVAVYNVVGELVYSFQGDKNEGTLSEEIQLRGASGVYFIELNSNNHTSTKKVIVNK